LPLKFVPVQAHRGIGIVELKQALAAAADATLRELRRIASPFPPAFTSEVKTLTAKVNANGRDVVPRYLVERLLLDTSGYLFQAGLPGIDGTLLDDVQAARGRLAAAGLPVPAVESIARYTWAGKGLDGVVTR